VIKIVIKFKDLSLVNKLYLCIAVLIVLPLVLLGFYLNYQFAALSLNKSSESSLQTLKQTKQSFETMFEDTNDLSIRILSHELIQDFIKGKYSNSSEYDEMYWNINVWLEDVLGSKKYYDSVTLYSGKEVILHNGLPVPAIHPAILEKASRLQGEGFWVTAPGEISYYRAIMDFDQLGRMIGVERFEINEETIYQYYKNMNSFPGSRIFLLDSDSLVLSSTDRDLIGDNLGHLDYVQKSKRLKNGFFTADIQDVKSMVLFYTIEKTDWTLVQVVPEKSFTILKTTINTILFVAITLCILFGVLFSLAQHKYMLKPLQQLRKEMMKLKDGNFNIVLTVDSKDEIGEISRGFVLMAQQLKKTINDVYLTKIKQKEAELSALESQINPHFLYNTLDSIHWLALKHKNYDVSEQIEALAEIFKHVLNKGDPYVTIRQEVNFLENYMFIQQQKYGKRIKLHIDADPDLMNYKTPKLVLQPLVENAILHGLDQVIEDGVIEVKVTRMDQGIGFVVTDNGIGTDENKIQQMMNSPEETKNVFALKNIDDRIKINYGQKYGLFFNSKQGVGTRVEVRIPFIN
jgi:two-component system sensor histidine kinase YesM